MAKVNLTREEVDVLIKVLEKFKIADLKSQIKTFSKEKTDLATLRESEDYHDMADYLGPQKCEECND